MTGQTGQKLTALAAGALWALAVVILPGALGLPYLPAALALPGAFVAPGVLLAAMILRRALRGGIGGDARLIPETVELMVLALALWPFVAMTVGGWMVILLGGAFTVTRGLAWAAAGGAWLRTVALVATCLPTLFATFLAVALWAA